MVEDYVSGALTEKSNILGASGFLLTQSGGRENMTFATEEGTKLEKSKPQGGQGWASHLVREETHSRFQGDGGRWVIGDLLECCR